MGSLGQNIEKQHVGQLRVDATYTVGAARGDITYKFGPAFSLRAGWDVVLAQYGADVRVPQPPGIGENPPLVTEKYFSLKTLGNISRPAGYVEAQITPTERLKITPGLRVDREMFDEQTDLGPRLNARLDLIKSPGRLTAKAGGGLFYQQNEFVNRFPTFGGGKLQSEKAIHASAGLEQELTSKIDLSVEGFYKDLSRIAVRQADTRLANVGSGEVIGLETLLRWKPGGRLFGWVAYTLSKATRVDLPGGATRLFEYDQTHNLTALLSVKLGRGWQVGGRFRLVSGSPYTPCTGGVFDASSGIYRCIEGAPYSARLPAFHQLDLRVDKQWDFESWRLGVYLDALNVYNHKNPEAVTYSFDQSRSTYSNGVPFFPSIGVRGEM
jgi:outer membrane receptor protein involved in Fe transport